MAQLTVQTPRAYGLGYIRSKNDLPVKAAVAIFEGSMLGDDAAGAARQLVAADPFLGFAERDVDNTAGAVGAKTVRTIERGQVRMPVTGATGIGDVGEIVYASDGNTLTMTSTSNTPVGKIKRYVGTLEGGSDTTLCDVEFEAVQVRSL